MYRECLNIIQYIIDTTTVSDYLTAIDDTEDNEVRETLIKAMIMIIVKECTTILQTNANYNKYNKYTRGERNTSRKNTRTNNNKTRRNSNTSP